MGMKLREEGWKLKEQAWKSMEEAWKSKEEVWKSKVGFQIDLRTGAFFMLPSLATPTH